MEINEMTTEALEARKAEIGVECEAEGADTNALLEEVRAINTELEARAKKAAEDAEIRSAVAEGAGKVIEEVKETRKMADIEVRNSAEYINAYADYIKTGDAAECRALLSENGSGTVAVPELVYDIVKTAWDKEGIMSLVKKSYIKGNLKVGFEISASGAVIHTEGVQVDEENLTLGIVELVPKSIKKWISISDEALDLRGEAFLKYIYNELAYQIAKKAADELVAKIVACGTVSTTTSVGVPVVTATTISQALISEAIGKLSDEAANPVVIMNKATWAAFKAAQYAGNFAADIFEGLPVVYNNSLSTFAAATTGVTYAIVGDLGQGALANFPNGEGIDFKVDDLTKMDYDLVRVLGREFVGLGIVAPNAFCKINH